MVDLQALADRLLLIVLPLDQARAVLVADALVLGRVELQVVDVAALRAHPAATQAAHHLVVGDLDQEHRQQSPFQRGERIPQRVGLLLVAGEAVQQEPVARIGSADAQRRSCR